MPITEIETEIAGVVFRIDAAPGTTLADGDSIVTLESMKMEIPITAPRPGKLVDICVAEGDSLQAGQVVARIDTQ
jgi:biotin carboxyl carrier protein